MTVQAQKPFPNPGTAWRFSGAEGLHVVTALRWFSGQAQAEFGDRGSCAGVEHMMMLDAWEHVPGVRTPGDIPFDLLTKAQAALDEMRSGPIVDVSPERSAQIIARALAEERAKEREACLQIARAEVENPDGASCIVYAIEGRDPDVCAARMAEAEAERARGQR